MNMKKEKEFLDAFTTVASAVATLLSEDCINKCGKTPLSGNFVCEYRTCRSYCKQKALRQINEKMLLLTEVKKDDNRKT